MKINELLKHVNYCVICGCDDNEVNGVYRDSRKAKPGSLFICTTGTHFNTHNEEIIAKLVDMGIKSFVTESDVILPKGFDGTVIRTDSSRKAGAHIYCELYGNPSSQMTMIAVTGSKGKTTTTHMLAAILEKAGHKVGIIGTNGVTFSGVSYELTNTTPDYDETQHYLKEMADVGVDTCVCEVSSQGMKYHRMDGIIFDYAIWTNLQEGDHIGPNEHESFGDYMYWKAEVLNHAKLAIVNKTDKFFDDFIHLVKVPYVLFGSDHHSDYRAYDMRRIFDKKEYQPGIFFKVEGKVNDNFWINLPGAFNVWNALGAIGAADQMGVETADMKAALSDIHIKGRHDIVYKGKFLVCVDFAHNGASAWYHLKALKEYRPKRLVCVFSADGNRSPKRRYGMGKQPESLRIFLL